MAIDYGYLSEFLDKIKFSKKMKRIVLIVSALMAFNLSFSQSIQGKITYQATLDPGTYIRSINNDSIMPQKRKNSRIKRAVDAVPTNFLLFFNDVESIYHAENDMYANRKLGLLLNQTGNVGRQDFTYYTNTTTKEKFYQGFFTSQVLVNMEKLDWKLTQETKKIGKYTCYKATAIIDSEQTSGMNFISPVIAWYTPQIPVPFGIQTFVGLPGLTLELIADYENGKIYYQATKIELNPEKEIKIKRPKGQKKVAENEFVEMLKNMSRR